MNSPKIPFTFRPEANVDGSHKLVINSETGEQTNEIKLFRPSSILGVSHKKAPCRQNTIQESIASNMGTIAESPGLREDYSSSRSENGEESDLLFETEPN